MKRNEENKENFPSEYVVGWCFFGVANIILLDSRFYAVNVISRNRIKEFWISFDGEKRQIFDAHEITISDPRRDILSIMDSKISLECPAAKLN
jgi:hypothetical protein